jgi:ferrochelatase
VVHVNNANRTAVLLMAYGTPRSPDDIEAYYTDIRRGSPPTREALADLTARYAAIGGVSPLAERTAAQCDALQAALDAIAPGTFHVALGLKHSEPKVEAVAEQLADDGFGTIIGLVLAPHYSAYSIGQYHNRLTEGVAASRNNPVVQGVESWATERAFIDFTATDLRGRLDAMRASLTKPVRVLFTAHSLPERIVQTGDRYVDELRSTAQAVAAQLDLTEHVDWQIAWQSAGRTPEPWIGPDILQVIDDLAVDETGRGNIAGVIVSAVGFVADHLEVLFDLDVEAAKRAATAGLSFDRTACVNADPAVMAALANRVAALCPPVSRA